MSGGIQGELRLWEMRSRELISHLKEHAQIVTNIVIFPDDTQALSSSRDRNILRWDLRSEKRVFCHEQRMGGINDIALTSDATAVYSVGQERRLIKWGVNHVGPLNQQILDGNAEADEGKSVEMYVCFYLLL